MSLTVAWHFSYYSGSFVIRISLLKRCFDLRDRVKVALIQFAPVWLKQQENAERMKNFAEKAAEEGAQLIVFPELANIGYVVPVLPGQAVTPGSKINTAEFAIEYVKASEPIPGPTTELLAKVTKKYDTHIVVGLAQLHPTIPATLFPLSCACFLSLTSISEDWSNRRWLPSSGRTSATI